MPDWLNGIAEQFKQLPPARQAALLVTAVGSLAFFLWMSNGATNSQYRLLFRGLDETEVASVVDALAAENIDHRLEEAGTAIHVPAAMVHEARIRLAAKGLPAGTDMRLFLNEGGIPAVLFGPGDLRVAHAANESVDVEDVATCASVLTHWVRTLDQN